jgi:hypothetical protein
MYHLREGENMRKIKIPKGWKALDCYSMRQEGDWYWNKYFKKFKDDLSLGVNALLGAGLSELTKGGYGYLSVSIRRVSESAPLDPNEGYVPAGERRPRVVIPPQPFMCSCWTYEDFVWQRGEELVLDSDQKCYICGAPRRPKKRKMVRKQ